MLICLALSALPARLAIATDGPSEAVHVTGTSLISGTVTGGERAFNFENVTTSHAALDGCYFLEVAGGSEAGSWGTLTVYDGNCQYFGSVEGRQRTWEGTWFVPDHGPGWVRNLHLLASPVWLHGRGPYEGSSAVLDFGAVDIKPGDFWEGGSFEAWVFPTPPPWQRDL